MRSISLIRAAIHTSRSCVLVLLPSPKYLRKAPHGLLTRYTLLKFRELYLHPPADRLFLDLVVLRSGCYPLLLGHYTGGALEVLRLEHTPPRPARLGYLDLEHGDDLRFGGPRRRGQVELTVTSDSALRFFDGLCDCEKLWKLRRLAYFLGGLPK